MIAVCALIAAAASAQVLETTKTDYPTGYVNSSVNAEGYTIGVEDGVLYFVDYGMPIVLVKYPPMKADEEFTVPATVKRIMNGAFDGVRNLRTLKLHSTVSALYPNMNSQGLTLSIGETAFANSSIENFEIVTSGTTSFAPKVPVATSKAEEYNIEGKPQANSPRGIYIR